MSHVKYQKAGVGTLSAPLIGIHAHLWGEKFEQNVAHIFSYSNAPWANLML